MVHSTNDQDRSNDVIVLHRAPSSLSLDAVDSFPAIIAASSMGQQGPLTAAVFLRRLPPPIIALDGAIHSCIGIVFVSYSI